MSRPMRIEFPDALYHVTARGDRCEDIFSYQKIADYFWGTLHDGGKNCSERRAISVNVECYFNRPDPVSARVYLKAYDGVSAAQADFADYLGWYNTHRPHSSLERLTPHEKYLAALPQLQRAA